MWFVLRNHKPHAERMNDIEQQNRELHVILGAGQVGSRLARRLIERGQRVRLVQRRSPHQRLGGVEPMSGDITRLDFAEAACAGAAVVYDCMNPAYHEWPRLLLPIGRGALHGAARAGAKLVALDCLYMYGRQPGPMTEDSPLTPCSKKGALRVELADLRLAAHQRGDTRVAIGRASDFFGSDLPFSLFGRRFFERLLAGKAGECMGDPDQPHSYTYVNDVARALETLGSSDAALGRVWHLPTGPAESSRELARRFGKALGVRGDMVRVPKLVLRTLGVFSPFMREVLEMTYQWEAPFVLDDTRFRQTFGQGPTPIETAVAETAEWARRLPAKRRAA
jgi:nucleoside-diphosphate-sugar epimerase